MVQKSLDSERTDISTELHARIVELSTLLWQGNRSKMARDLGIDQPTISRVLSGDQKPSAKFLERLATLPQVNVGWLFLGQGEPQAAPGMRPGVGGFRPLLDELLPGSLQEHRDRLFGVSYPVAAAFDTQTSYWYRVPANSPVTSSDCKVKAGDLMLIETDASWTRKGGAVGGKFCGFRVRKGKAEIAELWWVDSFDHSTLLEGYEQYRVDTFRKGDEAWLIVPLDANGEKNARRTLSGLCLTVEDVMGVCVKLERPFMRNAGRPGSRS